MDGDEAYTIPEGSPPLAEITATPQPYSPPPSQNQPAVATVEAEDTHGDDSKIFEIEHQQPGGDVVLGHIPAAVGSAGVIKEDPLLRFEGEDLPLPYGNDDTGVTSEIPHAPLTGGPSGTPPVLDKDVEVAPSTRITAGTNDSITTTTPSAPATMGTDGTPVEKDAALERAPATDQVTTSISVPSPKGPAADSTRDHARAATLGESGAAIPNPPTTQYGTSAP